MIKRAIMASVLAILAGGGLAAQSAGSSRPRTSLSEAEETALALSALPESMRATAAVHVLGLRGYRKVRDGSSGINCLVERSRPDTQEPICWDREGSDTIMPVALARAEWRAAGIEADEIERRVNEGFAAGRFRAPRRGGIAYMLSTENYVFNGERVVKYLPHVMSYAPYVTNADIGASGQEPYAPWVLNEGTPHAYIIIVTRNETECGCR